MSEPTLDEMNTVVAEYLGLWKRGEKCAANWMNTDASKPEGWQPDHPHDIPPPSLLTDWSAFGAALLAMPQYCKSTKTGGVLHWDQHGFDCQHWPRTTGVDADPRIAFVRAVFKLATRDKP